MTTTLARLPEQGPTELLFLLLHGHAQTPEAMLPLAEALGREYPQAAVLCIQSPDPAEDPSGSGAAIGGYQYFPRVDLDDERGAACVQAALPPFIAMVRSLQRQFAMPWQRTALAGFSQGAIVALEAVQAEPALAGRVLAFAGRHVRIPDHAPADTTLHLLHGLADDVVPSTPVIDAANALVLLGADITADIVPGVGHQLHPKLIAKGIEQLRSFVPRRLWREAMSEAPLVSRPASSRDLGEP